MGGGRTVLKTMAASVNSIKQLCQREYVLRLDNRMFSELKTPTTLRRRPRGTESLRRFWGRVPSHWPLPNTVFSAWPLYLYYKLMIVSGQQTIAFEIVHFLRMIVSAWRKWLGRHSTYQEDSTNYYDDFIRHYLKELSGYSFPRIFTHGPAYMLITHLHALTGKAPFTTEQIVSDIEKWISEKYPDGREKVVDMESFDGTMDRVFSQWYRGEAGGHLTFRQYCNDYMRWATSGGAPRVELFGERYRTKWAWAYRHSTNADGTLRGDYDLYDEALRSGDTANVALKEEPQKTRPIITTPMASYLRQCYLLYRWGKPRLPSPISSNNWIPVFEAASPRWYGCIDGERFDHSIPRAVILSMLDRFGNLDEETRMVADWELESMEKLELTWGNHKWKWQAGLLSGWRMTSVFGTLVSAAAAEYIISKNGVGNSLRYGVMGDDIVLYSHVSSLTTDEMVDNYVAFGLNANASKTASGPVGEFLRKVRSMGGSWGYPALGLRSVIGANPWISKYTYDNETEMSGAWLTLYSRLLPHTTKIPTLTRFLYGCIVSDLTTNFGHNNWLDWLLTPISAGGGGCMEVTDVKRWTRLARLIPMNEIPEGMRIPAILGILKTKKVTKKMGNMVPIDMYNSTVMEKQVVGNLYMDPFPTVRHGVSKTALVFDIMFGEWSISKFNRSLNYPIPRSLRVVSRSALVDYLLSGSGGYSGLTAITHTKESISRMMEPYVHMVTYYIRSKKNSRLRELGAAVTLHAMRTMRSTPVPYGTW